MVKIYRHRILIFLLPVLFYQSCARHYFRSDYKDAHRLIHETIKLKKKPFLKAHLKNGDVCILKDSWKIDTTTDRLTGVGILYDYKRVKKVQGPISIAFESISIYETNNKFDTLEPARVAGLLILEAVNLYLIGVVPRL